VDGGMMGRAASPIYAGIYQFIIVAMILAASGNRWADRDVAYASARFSAAAQLTLRPGERRQAPDDSR